MVFNDDGRKKYFYILQQDALPVQPAIVGMGGTDKIRSRQPPKGLQLHAVHGHAPVMHLLCNFYAPIMHLSCTFYALLMHELAAIES